jgi:hypothetical protein
MAICGICVTVYIAQPFMPGAAKPASVLISFLACENISAANAPLLSRLSPTLETVQNNQRRCLLLFCLCRTVRGQDLGKGRQGQGISRHMLNCRESVSKAICQTLGWTEIRGVKMYAYFIPMQARAPLLKTTSQFPRALPLSPCIHRSGLKLFGSSKMFSS